MAVCPVASAPGANPAVNYVLIHGSPAEIETRSRLQHLLQQYDLSNWIWTRTIVIDSEAIPHSHPRLTIHTRHRDDDLLLLSTFVHEEYHWFETAHPKETAAAIRELRKMYPGMPVGGRDGGFDNESTYLHIIVCYAEYQKMKSLVGPDRSEQVMQFWANDHYRKIYRLVLDHEQELRQVIARHRLLPADPGRH